MKIGIASDDGKSIAQHFGRAKGFVITEVVDNQIGSSEFRPNTFTNHNLPDHQHQEGHGHSHASILSALSQCDVVLARGMGRRIYDDLRQAEIKSVITTLPDVNEAVRAYIEGTLLDHPEKGCQH